MFPQVIIIILQLIIFTNDKDGGGLFLGSYIDNRQLERIELYNVPPMHFARYSLEPGGLLLTLTKIYFMLSRFSFSQDYLSFPYKYILKPIVITEYNQCIYC